MTRVLVATDGSEPATVAVDLVAGIPWPDGTIIRVVEAIETGAEVFGGPWPAVALVQSEALEAALRMDAQQTVEGARARLQRPGLEVESAVLVGRPASVIVEAARAMEADLIVVGSRGHGIIGSMLLGSVSAEIVDHASMPVLVARGPVLDRVVLAWDGSACASRAADLVRQWPIFRRCSVRVVSVADVGAPWWTGFPDPASSAAVEVYLEAADASRSQHAELADGMTADLRAAGLSAEADKREGDAASQILAVAGASGANLIVLGTHGRSRLQRIFLGSVARNVLHHAQCSVLIVREVEASNVATGEPAAA